MTSPPPSPFPLVNRVSVSKGTILHRIHGVAFGPGSFNPCRGRPTRFAPLVRPGRLCIPTAYLAQSFECAVHETVFHEVPYDAPLKTVDVDSVRMLRYSTVSVARNLTLAALFEPDLNRWGISRRDLIDTFASDYVTTADWAVAIHDACPDVDGLVWTSRRCDPERAYVLFGDRPELPFVAGPDSTDITTSPDLMEEIRKFGHRAGITLIV